MNILKTRKGIHSILKTCAKGGFKVLEKDLFESPVLTLSESFNWEELMKIRGIGDTSIADMEQPFKLYSFRYKTEEGDVYLGICNSSQTVIEMAFWDERSCKEHAAVVQVKKDLVRSGADGIKLWFAGKLNSLNDTLDEESKTKTARLALMIFANFWIFYVDMKLPLASVEISNSNSKVSWVKKKQWFTVLDFSHAANDRNVKAKSLISQDNTSKQRVAHHRRAHYRTLKSQRWGNLMGKRVFVKQAWVGPNEWRNGKQIYKIISN